MIYIICDRDGPLPLKLDHLRDPVSTKNRQPVEDFYAPAIDLMIQEHVTFQQAVTLLDKDIISDLPVQRVRETMKALSEADGPKNCIIDLSKVRFISSVPLGGIITLNREALGRGGKLIMCLAQPVIRDFFRVTMLDTIIPMVDRFDDAVKCTED